MKTFIATILALFFTSTLLAQGPGNVQIQNGKDVAEGSTTDAAAAAGGTGSVSAKLRTITSQLGGTLAVSDPGVGGVSDAAATSGSTGSVSAKLRLITSQLAGTLTVTDTAAEAGIGGTADAAASAGGTGSVNAKLRLVTNQLAGTLSVNASATPATGAQTATGSDSILCATDTGCVLGPGGTSSTTWSFVSSTALEASHIAKASAGNFFGFAGFSSNVGTQFILCFNSATLPANGTASVTPPVSVGGSQNFSLSVGAFGMNFSSGITCANSSTEPLLTVGAADTFFTIFFK